MLNKLKQDHAFTLIELLVVILIISILVAVAVPSFLGQEKKAQESKAKVALNIAYKAAKAGSITFVGDFPPAPVLAGPESNRDSILSSEPQFEVELVQDIDGVIEPNILYVLQTGTDEEQMKAAYATPEGIIYGVTAYKGNKPDYYKYTQQLPE